MAATPRTVQTADGAEIGVWEFGDPTGSPVLALHGVPACGAGFSFADESAKRRKIRLLAPDRPGVGLSAPLDGWTVGSYPAQVERFADALDLGRFAVWGYSGGGPYAVACAAVLTDRLTRVAVVAGMGEMGEWAEADDFEKADRMLLKMSRKRPWLARTLLSTFARLARLSPKSAIKSFSGELSPADREVVPTLGSPAEAMALFTGAFLRGARGVVDDYRAIGEPWGVDLASITVPVRIYQGDSDTMVPLRHAEELARRIPGSELITWPGEGHLGTVTHVDDILDWLTQPAEAAA
ncbi:MAG: alpha/beta fold hydrolase [Solirubrobacteraceae bacterium]